KRQTGRVNAGGVAGGSSGGLRRQRSTAWSFGRAAYASDERADGSPQGRRGLAGSRGGGGQCGGGGGRSTRRRDCRGEPAACPLRIGYRAGARAFGFETGALAH